MDTYKISGFWNDMNVCICEMFLSLLKEPAIFGGGTMPTDVQHSIGDHRFVHNIYGMLMARATYEGLDKLQAEERPFVLTRSGFAGIQKYGWTWTGDNTSTWEHLGLRYSKVASRC